MPLRDTPDFSESAVSPQQEMWRQPIRRTLIASVLASALASNLATRCFPVRRSAGVGGRTWPQQKELTRPELQAMPDDVMRDRALAAFKGWHSPVEALVSNTAKIVRTAIYDVPSLPRWHAGRVMLLGDAAHAMSPAGGQGASLALEDAMLVGKFLAGRSRPEEAFAKVESVLRLRAERMVRQATENDQRQIKELGPFGQWLRDRMFPLFAPVIARELRRQYTALEPFCTRAA